MDFAKLAAPLPRGYQWLDAVGYLSHVERMYKAFGTELPKTLREEPLMYQGASDAFLGPRDDIAVEREDWDIDLEGELAVVLGDVPMGVKREKAGEHIRLVMLANDVSLRDLVPAELAKGCGFVHSKTWTAFSPVAATPDELGDAWDGRKLHLPLVVHVNDKLLGRPDAGTDMSFDFARLIAHAARTRPLGAGTILGSGTVSNRDAKVGVCCIAEARALESARGKPTANALPEVRRPRRDRDARRRGPLDLRRDRAGRVRSGHGRRCRACGGGRAACARSRTRLTPRAGR